MATTYQQNKWAQKPPGPVSLNWTHPQTQGLIAYWPVLNSDGIRIRDVSDKGFNNDALSSSTAPQKIGGPYGPSLKYNGSSTKLTATGSYPTTGINFTITIRTLLYATGVGINSEFFERDNDSTDWGIQYMLNNSVQRLYIVNQVPTALNVDSTTSLSLNRWYSIGVTYNGTTASFYLNGKSDGGGSMSASSIRGSQTIFTMGSSQGNVRPVNGCMDDVRFYNRCLSPAEILDIYQNPTAIFTNQSNIMYSSETAGPAFIESQFFMAM